MEMNFDRFKIVEVI